MDPMLELFTRKDWALLPEGFPAELIDGFLVREPAPSFLHQRVAARIRRDLLQRLGPDRVPDTPADVALDDHNVFQPDIVVLDRLPPDDASAVGVPLLVVEVLSPATEERDRDVKAGRLLAYGVAEVWLVDPRKRSIEVRTPRGTVRVEGPEAATSAVVEGFSLVPDALFPTPRPG